MTRLGLVGAGFISRVHAEAFRSLGRGAIAAVIDPDLAAAQRLARDFGSTAYASLAEAQAGGGFDRAHVLVPPDLHAAVTGELIAAGIPVLLEKPLAARGTEAEALVAQADAAGVALGVNQNFVHHPAFVRLRRMVAARQYGRPRFVSCIYNASVRQMTTRQFGHWMFREPVNILLEQAVHPLSQIIAVAGPVRAFQALAGDPIEIAPGVPFTPACSLSLACARLPAQLRFAVGESFPFFQVSVVCDDGVVVADILANRTYAHGRTRWLEAVSTMEGGVRMGAAIARDSVANLAGYGAAMLKLRDRNDAFYLSMRDSIAAFHDAVDAGREPELDGRFGADLVALCEQIRDQAFAAAPVAAPAPAPGVPAPDFQPDIALLGGTGFIGVHTVRQALAAGKRVAVMARSLRNLPAVFSDPRVRLHRGDIRNAGDVAAAIAGAPVVVNLAHGGGGASFEEVRAAMVGGAEIVARACQAAGVRRLVHVGSIASLYLGPQAGPVTGATPSDPRDAERADYSRAKVLSDRLLLDLHAREGLPVVILRPGIVVGEGGPAFHSGVGFTNTEQHTIGWGNGRTPLPFVLVEDTAAAILSACDTPGLEGRAYNIVGDVRLTAREYIAELAAATGRPLAFHPQSPLQLWVEDLGKWVVKRIGGRDAPRPPLRDFRSRAMTAAFDCADAKRDLAWTPEADRDAFLARAVGIHVAA